MGHQAKWDNLSVGPNRRMHYREQFHIKVCFYTATVVLVFPLVYKHGNGCVQARLHAYRTGRLYQSLMAAMLGAIGSPSAANVHASH